MISLSLLSGLSFWQLVWREGRWATASNTGRGLPPEGRLGKPGYEKIGRRTAAPALENRIFLRGGDVCTQTRKWLLLCFSLCRADLRFPVFKQGQPWPATQLSCLPGTGWLTDWGVVASPCGFCQCRVLVKSIFQAYYDYLYRFMITWYIFFVMRPLGDLTFCGIFKFLCRNSEFNVSPVSGPVASIKWLGGGWASGHINSPPPPPPRFGPRLKHTSW